MEAKTEIPAGITHHPLQGWNPRLRVPRYWYRATPSCPSPLLETTRVFPVTSTLCWANRVIGNRNISISPRTDIRTITRYFFIVFKKKMKNGYKNLQAFTSRANTKQSVYIITHYFNLQHIKNGRNDTEYKKTCRTTGSFPEHGVMYEPDICRANESLPKKQTPVHNKNKSGNRSFIEPAAGRAKLRKLLPFPFQNQNRPTRKAFTKALASSPV